MSLVAQDHQQGVVNRKPPNLNGQLYIYIYVCYIHINTYLYIYIYIYIYIYTYVYHLLFFKKRNLEHTRIHPILGPFWVTQEIETYLRVHTDDVVRNMFEVSNCSIYVYQFIYIYIYIHA